MSSDSVFVVGLGAHDGRSNGANASASTRRCGTWRPVRSMSKSIACSSNTGDTRSSSPRTFATPGARRSEGRPRSGTTKRRLPDGMRHGFDEALDAAHALGVPARPCRGHASVFTTQTITSVMERIRDDIKAGNPAPADFLLGPRRRAHGVHRAPTWRASSSGSRPASIPPGSRIIAVNLGATGRHPRCGRYHRIRSIHLTRLPGAPGRIHPGRRHRWRVRHRCRENDGLLHAVFAIELQSRPTVGPSILDRRGRQRQSACLEPTIFASSDGQPRPGDDRNQPCRAGVRPAGQTADDQDRRDRPRHSGCRTGCRSER